MAELNNNVERNTIKGVGENSYMHRCYFGSVAKITGGDIQNFLQGFIKGLRGEVGLIYSVNPQTNEVEGVLAISAKANSSRGQNINGNGMIPIPGLNSGNRGNINPDVLKSVEKIKLQGTHPTVMGADDVILFQVDFAAIAGEMMNPERGYEATILDFKVLNKNNVEAIVAVVKSKNQANQNRLTRFLQNNGDVINRKRNHNRPQQPQRYNGNR